MRFNPDTERAVTIEEIATQCHDAVISAARPARYPFTLQRVWDPKSLGYVLSWVPTE